MSLSRLLLLWPAQLGGLGYRGDTSKTGGVPSAGGHTGERGPDLQLSPTLACSPTLSRAYPHIPRRCHLPGELVLAKGRGTWRTWGGLQGLGPWQLAVMSSPPLAALCGGGSFKPNFARFGEVSGPGAVPGGTPAFQCHSREKSTRISLEKWNCSAKAFHKGKKTELGNIGSNDRSLAKSWTSEREESKFCCGHCSPGEASNDSVTAALASQAQALSFELLVSAPHYISAASPLV